MIGQLAAMLFMVGLAVVAGVASMSWQKSTQVEQATRDVLRRMAPLAEELSLQASTLGGTALFPPAGVNRAGIYGPPDLGLATGMVASAQPYLYCPYVPQVLARTGTAVQMAQPSGANVTASTFGGMVVAGPPPPAGASLRPLAALVVALPGNKLPDCSDVVVDGTSAVAPGAVVRLVFGDDGPKSQALTNSSTVTVFVAANADAGASGLSSDHPTTLARAIDFWSRGTSRVVRVVFTSCDIVESETVAALDRTVRRPTPGRLILDGGCGQNLTGTWTFDAGGDLTIRNLNPGKDSLIRVSSGNTLRLGGGSFGHLDVRAGGTVISDYAYGSSVFGRGEPVLRLAGRAVGGFAFIDQLGLESDGTVTLEPGAELEADVPFVYSYDAGPAVVVRSSGTRMTYGQYYSYGPAVVLEPGAELTLSHVNVYSASPTIIRATSASLIFVGDFNLGNGNQATELLGGSRMRWVSSGEMSIPGPIVADPSSRLEGNGVLNVRGWPGQQCLQLTDPAAFPGVNLSSTFPGQEFRLSKSVVSASGGLTGAQWDAANGAASAADGRRAFGDFLRGDLRCVPV